MNGRRSRMVRRSMALALTAKPAAVGILALTPQAASAANVTVACASGGAGLRAAILSANASGGTVTLAAGCTYSISSATTPGEALPLITGTVVVNGNGATITRSGATALRMFHVRRGGNLTLDHVTVSNGLTVNNVGGAGVYNELGTLSITSSTLSGNKATASIAPLTGKGVDATGGGILTTGSTTITNSVVSGNQALATAAAIPLTSPAKVAFNAGQNFATGGGIAAKGGTLKVVNSTISGNLAQATGTGGATAEATGGGISSGSGNLSVTVTVTGSTVSGNRAFSTSSGGTSNPAGTFGGGLTQLHTGSGNDSLTVINTTVAGNTADSSGGLTLGSAILEFGTKGDTLSVINSTIAGNTTTGNPKVTGAVQNFSSAGGSTSTLTNTIIASNNGSNCAGTFVDGGSNISFPATDKSCKATFGQGNPVLGPLQDNGGPTKTMALGTASAAIDTAFAIPCGQALPGGAGGVDQRGLPRMEVLADPKCDIGAFEVQPVVAAVQPTASATPALPKAGIPGSGSGQGLPWPLIVPLGVAVAGASVAAGRRLRGAPEN